MADFTFDTSGAVVLYHAQGEAPDLRRWSDLAPFTQGYVEALFASLVLEDNGGYAALPHPNGISLVTGLAFSDLAPETLAAILRDCAAYLTCGKYRTHNARNHGAYFYEDRQSGRLPDFSPLTVSLGDDGRVYLREAA